MSSGTWVAGVREYQAGVAASASGVPGAIVECGVYMGASAAALARGLPGRHVWLYDSFEGFPAAGPQDPEHAHEMAGQWCGSVAAVREALRGCEHTIVQGWFADTLVGPRLPEQVAVLHIDCDWYESVLLALQVFYERVAPGGVVLLDDFGAYEGARRAFYAWACQGGHQPLLERWGLSQAYWHKGREHNRRGTRA